MRPLGRLRPEAAGADADVLSARTAGAAGAGVLSVGVAGAADAGGAVGGDADGEAAGAAGIRAARWYFRSTRRTYRRVSG